MRRHYNIHGLLRVTSDVTLPELEHFRAPAFEGAPDIDVRVALRGAPRAEGVHHTSIREFAGRAGFAVDLQANERRQVAVTASPLLRFSPHVLYTNVVEPILRWQLVEAGYVFAHGACIASGERALLVTAQTDTGKTTTILKTLDVEPYGFLSDDLTIMDAAGRLWCYPKPLTISSHTVAAVRAARLLRHQRATLPLQSRIHSRGGRKIAFRMTQSRLPVATINTLAQLVVPPPKYAVTTLVPGTSITERAALTGMAVIVRAQAHAEQALEVDEATRTLIANTDDAFGFPPYARIEEFMTSIAHSDLRALERSIITSALEGVPSVRLESANMGWADRVRAWMRSLEEQAPAADAARAFEASPDEPMRRSAASGAVA